MPPDPAVSQDIVCEGLAKTYEGPVGVEAVAPLDIVFEAGRTTALVGPSGCGKSTILRLVAGLERPSAGTVRVGNAAPAEIQARGALAMAFQDPSLLPWRTVRGNLALALKLARRPVDRAAIDRLIGIVGLAGFEDVRPAQLSGGMRQRAAIARCLVTEPELLILDEPFGAVDELTRFRLTEELPALWRSRGTTALMVTHSVREAVLVADRVLVFSDRPARVVADIPVRLARRGAEAVRSAAYLDLCDAVSEALGRGDGARRLVAE